MSGPSLSDMRAKFGGADRNGSRGFLVPGPGHGPDDRSLSILFGDFEGGFWCESFAGDGFAECRRYVARQLGIEPDAPRRALPLVDCRVRDTEKEARDLWHAASPFRGSLAETYLSRRLGGWEIPEPVYASDALRWHGGKRALVAAMTDPQTGEFTGVHRTFLDSDGTKRDRLMLGRKGIVRLWPDDAVTLGLAIGEGLESTLAGVLKTGFAPAWAALDAGNLAKFPVLPGVEAITIFADHDESGTGQSAAETCARRWADAGIEARVLTPNNPGADFADLALEAA